ncbi:lysosomal alpha-mannosidase-like [Amphiura filiformis]|uniref:lysosomal alpha-mannosidase-like n=1 Tax=Amphiura filiformis TaxID=82378 RepID=UPI003B21FBF3
MVGVYKECFLIVVLSLLLLNTAKAQCGYESCPAVRSSDYINVHIVPHTHDDVGWLKTVDQYFYGGRNDIQHAGVQYILDSVIPELQADPNKRFIYVEIAFFERWWNEQPPDVQSAVKELVAQGRLTFINGGWCMNDEASTHYNAIIDQMTLGLKFIDDNFGSCGRPLVAWHIDPFGHSREQASLFAQMHYDGFFFGRLDYDDKKHRLKETTMEEIWHASPSLGGHSDLFYGALYNGYGPPGGFCWDIHCSDTPFQDDPRLFDYNVDDRVKDFIKAVKDQVKHFKTNHIIMTMGSDFQFENAHTWYKNLDKLIAYVNKKEEDTKIHLLYSTPACYVKHLNEADKTWTTKSDDFFPYADAANDFWTGYFTSRPAIKGYVRQANNFLQICKQLEVLGGMQKTGSSVTLKKAMGVAQHHDAVSGTEKQHVANDYAKRIGMGISSCESVVNSVLNNMMTNGTSRPPQGSFCGYLNISICPSTEDAQMFTVTAYNPVAHMVHTPVRVPVNGNSYTVTGPDGKMVSSQIMDVTTATKNVRRDRGKAMKELVFTAQVPALGFSTYMIATQSNKVMQKLKPHIHSQPSPAETPSADADPTISNEHYQVIFDGTTGLLKSITELGSNTNLQVSQSYYWYNSSTGNNVSHQASGAYIFRPNSSEAFPLFKDSVDIKMVTGDVVQEIHQTFQPWLSQVVRLYKGQPYVEFEWTVGPIPVGDHFGKEIISRFDTDIMSDEYVYTDANGREMVQRKLNHRDTWKYNNTEPVAGNYYPVNSRIYIMDDKKQLTVLNDRSQGGASLKNGSMELMVHRRCLKDDSRGVGEPLNETGQYGDGLMIRGKHLVTLSIPGMAAAMHRTIGEQVFMAPSLMFAQGESDWASKYKTSETLLMKDLPVNVHLLTLELWDDNTALIRLEHQFAKGEDADLSKNATVSLKGLFKSFDITGITEISLGANVALKDATRLQWKTTDSSTPTPPNTMPLPVNMDTMDVELTPMQIRTFRCTIKRK